MKRFLELLSPEERAQHDRSLNVASAPTEAVRKKAKDVREVLARHCYFSPEAETRWGATPANARQRIVSELIWRVSCIMDKSSTAVLGVTTFDMGFGFKLVQTALESEDALVMT